MAYPQQGGGSSAKHDFPIDLKGVFFSPIGAYPFLDLFIRLPVLTLFIGCATWFSWGADGRGCGTTPLTWSAQTWYHRAGCFVRGLGQTMPDNFQTLPEIEAADAEGQDNPDLVEGGDE